MNMKTPNTIGLQELNSRELTEINGGKKRHKNHKYETTINVVVYYVTNVIASPSEVLLLEPNSNDYTSTQE